MNATSPIKPTISIVVVSYNSREHIVRCLRSIQKSQTATGRRSTKGYGSASPYEIIVVDNASQDGTADLVARDFPEVRLLRSRENRGFAAGCNLGILAADASSEFCLLLNPDAVLAPDALRRALRYMHANPRAGILGGRLINPDGRLQPSARHMPDLIQKFGQLTGISERLPFDRAFATIDHPRQTVGTSGATGWVVGAFFLMRRSLLERTGLLDENYFLYFEEIDLCGATRRAGFEVHYAHEIQITHVGGASAKTTGAQISQAGSQLTRFRTESELYYYRKTRGLRVMLGAAALEIGVNTLIYAKHALARAENARRQQAAHNIKTMWRALRRAPFRAATARAPGLSAESSARFAETTVSASPLRAAG